MTARFTGWVQVGNISDIPKRGARIVRTAYGDIAVFRAEDETLFAMEDRCPHKGGQLSQGIVHDKSVTCPLHNWVIDLGTGEVKGPDVGCVRTIPVRTDNGSVLIDLSAYERAAVA